MRQDVVVVNRDDVSRACARAIQELIKNINDPEAEGGFYAMKILELSLFSSIVSSKLFEDEEEEHD